MKYIITSLLFYACSLIANNSNWTGPTNLTNSDGYLQQIATSSNGQYVYVIWDALSTTAIKIRRSSNFGSSFDSEISLETGSVSIPFLATSDSGQYVYAVWQVTSGPNQYVRFSRSTDFGQSFSTPVSITSESESAEIKGIVTSSNGEYVYVLDQHSDAEKVIYSSTFGSSWNDIDVASESGANPTIDCSNDGTYVYVTFEGTGSLLGLRETHSTNFGVTWSSPAQISSANPKFPFVSSSSTGEKVAISWINDDTDRVEISISNDFGDTWTTTILSSAGKVANIAKIATSRTNSYIHVVWQNTTDTIVQEAHSSNGGATWSSEATISIATSQEPSITSSNDGKYIYVTYVSVFGGGATSQIQATYSFDYGANYNDPTSTPFTTPTLSSGGFANEAQLTVSDDGQYVYATWNEGTTDVLVSPAVTQIDTYSVFGNQYTIRFPTKADIINKIYWTSHVEAISYKLYSDALATNLIAQTTSTSTLVHNVINNIQTTYYLVWLNTDGNEGNPISITLP